MSNGAMATKSADWAYWTAQPTPEPAIQDVKQKAEYHNIQHDGSKRQNSSEPLSSNKSFAKGYNVLMKTYTQSDFKPSAGQSKSSQRSRSSVEHACPAFFSQLHHHLMDVPCDWQFAVVCEIDKI